MVGWLAGIVEKNEEIKPRTLWNTIAADDALELAKFILSDATTAWKFEVLSIVTEKAGINDRKTMPHSF